MKNRKDIIVAPLLVILLIVMSACSNSSDDAISGENQQENESNSQRTDDSSKSNESHSKSTSKTKNNSDKDSEVATDENTNEQANNTDNNTSTYNVFETKENEVQEDATTDTVTKIEGRTELLKRLDNIQQEVDALPEKKSSDKGATNAMRSYYGVSYERYDKALNEIYALLKKSLPTMTMNELKTQQIKWIEQKEKAAEEERKKYEGGTFEYVAFYISLYESTKDRCYELINEYMTD